MKTATNFDLYVVEDDANYRESLKHSLENNFKSLVNVKTFPTGESCVKVLEKTKEKPKVIVLDYVLNGKWKDAMNGINTMDRIKSLGGEIPVIILSGPNDTELAIETLHLGACDYVVKDKYAFNHIRNSIEKCLHQRELHNEVKKYKKIVLAVVGVVLFILGWVVAAQIFAPGLFK